MSISRPHQIAPSGAGGRGAATSSVELPWLTNAVLTDAGNASITAQLKAASEGLSKAEIAQASLDAVRAVFLAAADAEAGRREARIDKAALHTTERTTMMSEQAPTLAGWQEIALEYHREQEGEYGCPGVTCPAVQRLAAFAGRVAALAVSAAPVRDVARLRGEPETLEWLRGFADEARAIVQAFTPHSEMSSRLLMLADRLELAAAPSGAGGRGAATQGPEEPTSDELRQAIETVVRGFDEGVFVRATDHDHTSSWMIKLMPYLAALATLKRAVNER